MIIGYKPIKLHLFFAETTLPDRIDNFSWENAIKRRKKKYSKHQDHPPLSSSSGWGTDHNAQRRQETES